MSKFLSRERLVKKEKLSHILLFCALMLVKNSRASLEQSVGVVPLVGGAKYLAEGLNR